LAPSSSLCCPGFLSLLSAMALTATTGRQVGPRGREAHILHRAGFGGCGMGTGHPVARSARRCSVKNCKCVLQHVVGVTPQVFIRVH
jgi:hypothetical protein